MSEDAQASPRARLLELAVENSLLVVLVATLATVLLGLAPLILVGDSWMTLVAGREVVEHGIPHRESLTVLADGRRWIDQQWLAQFLFYGAAALGGLRATMFVHVVLVTSATAIAVVAARMRGATARSTLIVASVCLLVAPWSWTLRAQSAALPLFVGTLALLTLDTRLRRRRTLLVFPLLVVWANVHGSVVLGAAITTLAGLICLGELAIRRPTDATLARALALVVLPWACLLATPYGTAIVSYYRLMFVDSPVSKAVVEWQAPQLRGYQIVFFVVAGLTVLLAILARRTLTLFDLGVLALTLAGSLRSARGIVWFALAVAVLLPVALDAVLPPDTAPIRRRLGLALCAGSCAMVAAAALIWLPRGNDWYESNWSRDGAASIERALRTLPPGRAVFAGDHHADWLLWKVPALRGRIAYDIRFELLNDAQWATLRAFRSTRPGWRRAANGYPIVVLEPAEGRQRISAFTDAPGARVLYRDDGIIVVLRTGSTSA